MTDENTQDSNPEVEVLSTVDGAIAHVSDGSDVPVQAPGWTPEQAEMALETLQTGLQTIDGLTEATRDIAQSVCTLWAIEKQIDATLEQYRIDADHAAHKIDKVMPAVEKSLDRFHDHIEREMDKLMSMDSAEDDEAMRWRRNQLIKLMMAKLDKIENLLMKALSL